MLCGQVRRRLTAHEIDIKDLETAVRGQGQESPREEIARLRQLQIEPLNFDISKEVRSDIWSCPCIALFSLSGLLTLHYIQEVCSQIEILYS